MMMMLSPSLPGRQGILRVAGKADDDLTKNRGKGNTASFPA